VTEFRTVAKTDEIPENSGKTIDLDGMPVAVFNVGGEFFAIHDTCPHAGGPLGEGELEGCVVTCPWHSWSFNVKTGECLTLPTSDVECYKVRVENEEVQIAI
jgi:NAD(P)H-dependent nitrite reductase small subunit